MARVSSTFRRLRTASAAALLLASLASAKLASATPAPDSADASRVEWNPAWPRFRPAEAAFTAGLALQAGQALFVLPPAKPRWHGDNLVDEAARNRLRLRTRKARDIAAGASDIIYYTLATYPLVVDAGIVTAGVHGSGDVALELLGMDLEAYAFAGAIAMTAEKSGRVRPEARGCATDPNHSGSCGHEADLSSSFLSGHTAIAATGAGLICAHHENLPLYGGGAPDVAACALAVAAASSGGMLRVMSDNHYASDVVLGMGLGLFAGYGLPKLLHYGFDGGNGRRGIRRGSVLPSFRSVDGSVAAVLAPSVTPEFAGVTMTGRF